MEKKHLLITYYKNMDSGIHVQKINNSLVAQTPHSHAYFQIYYTCNKVNTNKYKIMLLIFIYNYFPITINFIIITYNKIIFRI